MVVGVSEAAVLLGVNKPNFVRDYSYRLDFPQPIATLASGRIWWREEVEWFKKGTTMPINESTIARMAGNIGGNIARAVLAARVASGGGMQLSDETTAHIVTYAVALARALIAEVERTEPKNEVP